MAQRPNTQQLKEELLRERRKREYGQTLRSTIYILVVVAAVAVLIATRFLPVLQITGASMEPTLENDQIVIANENASFKPGDIIAFYYNNKILLKRVIGLPGDKIFIDPKGNVSVNGKDLDEPYLTEKSLGECDIDLPYQVPDGKIFVLGDHRITSVDSRSTVVGCVGKAQIVGKIVLRVWPLKDFAFLI